MLRDGNENIEDCAWHLFRIEWNAVTHTMKVSVDNQLRITMNKDLVEDIFGGNPKVYWGFAGSTGGSSNVQQFCAALHPSFDFDGGQIFCDGTPVTFKDNSSSFGTITRWRWDFGDGTVLTTSSPQPHLYAEAGKYDVKLVIEDNSGCISDTLKNTVTIGSYPEVKIRTAAPLPRRPAADGRFHQSESRHCRQNGPGISAAASWPHAKSCGAIHSARQLSCASESGNRRRLRQRGHTGSVRFPDAGSGRYVQECMHRGA